MSRPVCDLCTVKHEIIGNGTYVVRCRKQGERWAPMVDFACPDLCTDWNRSESELKGSPLQTRRAGE